MSDAAASTPSPAGDGSRPSLFGLPEPDAALLEEACRAALEERGIDGAALFRRLAEGKPLGAALGLPTAVGEHLYERAHRWFAVGRMEKAEPLFRALCTLDGADADAWVGLGVCLRMRDDAQGAALAFATAARLRPRWAVPAFHACELALRRGDLADAAEALRRFHALKDAQTPERMVTEAARLGQAIALRRENAPAPRAGAPAG